MFRRFLRLGFLCLVPLVAAFAGGPVLGAPSVQAVRIEVAPELDGLVNEAFGKGIKPATAFIQQSPEEDAPSTERTEVRVDFDDRNLYFGIICFDREPENIVVTQNRRDGTLDDTDSIQLLIDAYNDGQNAFVFGTSPTGIEFDAQVTKAGQTRGSGGGPARAGGAGGGGPSAPVRLHSTSIGMAFGECARR